MHSDKPSGLAHTNFCVRFEGVALIEAFEPELHQDSEHTKHCTLLLICAVCIYAVLNDFLVGDADVTCLGRYPNCTFWLKLTLHLNDSWPLHVVLARSVEMGTQ